MRRTAAETRSHVLEVAQNLFYWKGIRATGVDLVATEAGIAPPTLYRMFATKEDLVAAYVERSDSDLRELVATAAGSGPRDQILAIFDKVLAQISSGQFRGCAMMMTLAEFPDPDLPAHRNAVAAKSWIRETITELTSQLGLSDPIEVADHLTLALEGLLATGQALGPSGPASRARHLAETILAAASPRGAA
jgi:AcrR family transcriptional regulator